MVREEGLLMYWPTAVQNSVKTGWEHAKEARNIFLDLGNGQVNYDHLRPYLGSYSDIKSAHTVAKSPYEKNAVKEALSEYFSNTIAGSVTSAIVLIGKETVGKALPVNMDIIVKFPSDGTIYKFTFKGLVISSDGKVSVTFEPVSYTGRDAGITLSEGSYSGYRASGPDDALQRILQHMIASGVKVTIGDTIYRGGNVAVTRVICSNEPAKGCVAAE
ncbi:MULTISPECIES: hypothetical protein [Pseudoalteromonas]|nr:MULTISPECIES: hypothetical protein [Pseudoalteromonas]